MLKLMFSVLISEHMLNLIETTIWMEKFNYYLTTKIFGENILLSLVYDHKAHIVYNTRPRVYVLKLREFDLLCDIVL